MNKAPENEKKILTLTDIVWPNVSTDKDWNHIINQFWVDESIWTLPSIILSDSNREKIPNEDKIKKSEEQKLQSNPSYYNWRNIRLQWIELVDWKPTLIASEIDYLTNRVLWNKQAVSQILKNIWPEGLGAGLSISSIIITTDWKYLFWQKEDKNSQVLQDFIGWVVEVPKNFQYQKYKNLENQSKVRWLEYTLAREICEEIGIKFHRIDLENIKYLGIIWWGFWRFNIATIVPVYLSFDEIQTRFWQMKADAEKNKTNLELSEIVGLKKDEYIEYLSNLTKPKQMIAEKLKKL